MSRVHVEKSRHFQTILPAGLAVLRTVWVMMYVGIRGSSSSGVADTGEFTSLLVAPPVGDGAGTNGGVPNKLPAKGVTRISRGLLSLLASFQTPESA
jgi:hypothetical protein